MASPELSIVIPIYNESEILEVAVTELVAGLVDRGISYSIILAENGSTDDTFVIGQKLSAKFPQLRIFSSDEPNYGRALREGILQATGTFVICDEIDLCDLDFYDRSLKLLRSDDPPDMVVGSKTMQGSDDSRPVFRRIATKVLCGMLRVAVDFRGTDTHGLKAFNRRAVTPVVHACVIDKDIFASELVVRSGRAGLDVLEIPVTVAERRRPSVALSKRVPNVIKNIARLTYVIRFKG